MSESIQVAEAELPVDANSKIDTSRSDPSPSVSRPGQDPVSPHGFGIDLDSESSEDERSAFDRDRIPSDSDESDAEKPADATPDTCAVEPVEVAAPKELLTEPTEPSSEKEVEEKVDEVHTKLGDAALSESTDKENVEVIEDKAALEHSDVAPIPVKEEALDDNSLATNKDGVHSSTADNSQVDGDASKPSKHSSRETGTRWVKENTHERHYENSYPRGDSTRREREVRGKNFQRERERGRVKKENYSSYGHDDRFYADPPREKESYGEIRVSQGNPTRSHQGRGGKGRGGEDRWKHDKFNEEEQGPITVESDYSPPQRYDSNSMSTSYDKKGRGRGKKPLYNDVQPPVPGYPRNSTRQEHRGRGYRPRRGDTDRSSGNRRAKGRGSRQGYEDTEEDLGFDLSKPIVFVSQNKRYDSSTERDRSYRGPSLNSNELVKIGESEYIQSNASTPLPTIPILTSRQDFDLPLNNSKDTSQMKYADSYTQKRENKYSSTPGLISFAGVGRGKGDILAKMGREQTEKDSPKKGDPIYTRETRPYKESSPHPTIDPGHYQIKTKPQRYPAQRLEQQKNASSPSKDKPTSKPVPSNSTQAPDKQQVPGSAKREILNTKDTGLDGQVPSKKLEHPRQDKRSALADLKYSEFYPSPYKEEMVGNEFTHMQQFNIMADGSIMQDYMLPPEVKDGDPLKPQSFHQIQFPPFMPPDMAMSMKGPPEMMGGVPYMGNPSMAPEYMMPNEVPPNMQSDLFVPMPGFYPPI